MNQNTNVQDQTTEFEVEALVVEEFAQTIVSAMDDQTRVASTGFATCPAKTGQYC